jgi:Universal stress protein UspA and related nucleotide-binding proteins
MFTRILVPLDGSIHSEQALPVAARLACRAGGSLVLVQVISLTTACWPAQTQPSALINAVIDAQIASAQAYLARQQQQIERQGLAVTTTVLFGPVASTILSALATYHADLVVLYHQPGPADHIVPGTPLRAHGTAQTLIAQTPIPIFVVRDGSHEQLTPLTGAVARPLRVLVALDGSSTALAAIEPAAYLTAGLSTLPFCAHHRHTCQDLLLLTQVVQPLHFASATLDTFFRQDDVLALARHALHATAQQIREGPTTSAAQRYGIAITDTVVAGEDVATTLIEMTTPTRDTDGCDMIALAMHRHAADSLASVPQRLLHETHLPLLFIPPHLAEDQRLEQRTTLSIISDSVESGIDDNIEAGAY